MITPKIYKLAYTCNYFSKNEDTLKHVLYENVGDKDVEVDTFHTEEEVIAHLETHFKKVGNIRDYNLYIRTQ